MITDLHPGHVITWKSTAHHYFEVCWNEEFYQTDIYSDGILIFSIHSECYDYDKIGRMLDALLSH